MKKISLKQLNIFVLFLAIVLAFSGCGRKSEPVAENGDKSPLPPFEKGGEGENATSTNAGVEDTATSTDEIDTSDWKTYRNEEYGFELKYPKEWYIDNTRSSLDEIVFDIGIETCESRESIEINKNINNITYDQLREQKIKFYELSTLSISDLIIDGEKAVKIETSEFGLTRIFFLHSKLMYEITTGGRMEESILKTFRFIN
ncbi:MAG: PsbP-related protein [bacterium]